MTTVLNIWGYLMGLLFGRTEKPHINVSDNFEPNIEVPISTNVTNSRVEPMFVHTPATAVLNHKAERKNRYAVRLKKNKKKVEFVADSGQVLTGHFRGYADDGTVACSRHKNSSTLHRTLAQD